MKIQVLASLEGTRDDIIYALTVCVNALRSDMHVQRINGDWGEILILEPRPGSPRIDLGAVLEAESLGMLDAVVPREAAAEPEGEMRGGL